MTCGSIMSTGGVFGMSVVGFGGTKRRMAMAMFLTSKNNIQSFEMYV